MLLMETSDQPSQTPGRPERVVRRGDVLKLDVGTTVGSEQGGYRPWVIVSNDRLHSSLPIVIAIPLSTRVHKRNRAHRIFIPAQEIVPEANESPLQDSIALTEQVRVLSVDRLPPHRCAYLTGSALAAIEAGLVHVLDLF